MVKSECIYNSKNFSGMMKYPFRVFLFFKKGSPSILVFNTVRSFK